MLVTEGGCKGLIPAWAKSSCSSCVYGGIGGGGGWGVGGGNIYRACAFLRLIGKIFFNPCIKSSLSYSLFSQGSLMQLAYLINHIVK